MAVEQYRGKKRWWTCCDETEVGGREKERVGWAAAVAKPLPD